MLNLQSQAAEIPLRNTRGVSKGSALFGLKSIIVVEVENGPTYQFVVNRVTQQVIDLIERQRHLVTSAPSQEKHTDPRGCYELEQDSKARPG
jgi:hypothetical protein